MKLTLTKQMGLLFVLLATVVFLQTALVYRQFKRTESYGPFIDVSGRQRFFSQRIELLLERLPRGGTEDPEALRDTAAQIERAIVALDRGGTIMNYVLPPVPESVRPALERHESAWNDLAPILRNVLLQTTEQIRSSDSVEKALVLTQAYLDSSVQLVAALENWRAQESRKLHDATVGMNVLAVLILSAAVVLGWARMVAPLQEVKNKLSRLFPESAESVPIEPQGAEIESVAELVTEVEADVGRLRWERQEIEDELRQVEADYRSIFLNAVVGILQMDGEGKILTANPAVARILRYESLEKFLDKVTDAHSQIFTDPDLRKQLDTLSSTRPGAFELETEARCRDGEVIWVLVSGSLVEFEEKEPTHYELVLIDVTPRRKAQESLRELSGLLLRSQEEERRRVGRDLHDSTGQLLAALQMNLDRLEGSFQRLDPKDRELLRSCSKLAELCSREVRSVSHLLHPPLLEELGLEFALRDYAEGFEERSGIRVHLEISPELGRLAPDAETAFFRLVQEALTNIHRHAESPTADIRLSTSSREIRLEVEDRGRGFPPEILGGDQQPVARMGVGMRGMEERLRQLGGRLKIYSDHRGTRIVAELPSFDTTSANILGTD